MASLKKGFGFALVAMALLTLASAASAQPKHLEPGSALIFPLYDSTPGSGTVICVTNTNDSNEYCPDSDYRKGDIVVHYVYIDGDSCFEFDRFEYFTPGDTLCVLADDHNPEQDKGFLLVAAVDPEDYDRYVKFDYLIGSAITVQSELNFLWAYTPYPFLGRPDLVERSDPACERAGTDESGDDDGAVDFDGFEYSKFPERLFLSSFFEEREAFANQLVLLSTTGQDYIAEINFLFWNNIEDKFSRTFKFTCWWAGPLSEISAVVKDLNGDEEELGHGAVETGWASINPNRVLDLAGNPVMAVSGDNLVPPILGVYAHFITGSDFAAGHALHYTGTLDGLEILNGDGDLNQ
jgi:hypothetical protein